MRVLEGFCWFKVRSHDENGFFLKSFALCTHVSRKVISVTLIFSTIKAGVKNYPCSTVFAAIFFLDVSR